MSKSNLPANPLQSVLARAAKTLPANTGATAKFQRRYQDATGGTVVVCDTSGSMATSAGGQRRIDHLREAVDSLRGASGLAWIEFNSAARWLSPGEQPGAPSGGTALHLALDLAAQVRPSRTLVISDGEPDSEAEALVAADRLTGRIDVIYCGPDGGPGLEFLRRLARSTGGDVQTCNLSAVAIGASPLAVQMHRTLGLPAPRGDQS